MLDRTCDRCGADFHARKGGRPQRFCSAPCRRAWQIEHRWDDRPHLTAPCVICGTVTRQFTGTAICSDTCRRERERLRSARRFAADPERQRELNRAYYRRVGSLEWERYRTGRRIAAHLRAYTTKALIEQRMAYFGHQCWMCGAEATERDHVKPLAAGGLHLPANIRPACRTCNRRKKDRWPVELTRSTTIRPIPI